MTQFIGGHDLGLLVGSLGNLNRNDRSNDGSPAQTWEQRDLSFGHERVFWDGQPAMPAPMRGN